MSGETGRTQEALIFFSTRLDVVVVGSLLSGMSITVVMPPAAAAFVAVSMPAPQEGLMLLSLKVGLTRQKVQERLLQRWILPVPGMLPVSL